MESKPLKYKIEFKQAAEPMTIESKGCNAIIFTNRGVATAYVNNEPIATDQSISIAGLQNERDQSKYVIKFAALGTRALYYKLKYYVD